MVYQVFGFRVDSDHNRLGIDSNLSDSFGRSLMYALSALTTIATVSYVGGLPFIVGALLVGVVYWNGKHSKALESYLLLTHPTVQLGK